MSKNISIAEGGVARQFTNDKLKINLVGGGTEYYVPESGVQLTTKNVTANGTYKASDVGKYGFSQFSVNVPGGNGSAGSDGKPTGTVPPGGEGSAVVGEDEDGNEAVIGVDEDGKLVKTPLPSTIVLVTNPTKMSYNDGENIDLSGAVVTAKNADGTTWTDVDHPNGHVSCSPDPTAATADSEDHYISSTDGCIVYPFTITSTQWQAHYLAISSVDGAPYYLTSDAPCAGYIVNTGDAFFYYLTSGDATNVSYARIGSTLPPGQTPVAKGVWIGIIMAYTFLITDMEISPVNPSTETVIGSDKQTITLKWARPGDGKVLSTTMEISVSGSSSTTTSSSGTEGGGSF